MEASGVNESTMEVEVVVVYLGTVRGGGSVEGFGESGCECLKLFKGTADAPRPRAIAVHVA